jgi:ubiquinone/menaquinone biosynthesis C-methylase UbiE
MSELCHESISKTVNTYNKIVNRYSDLWLDDNVMHESLLRFIDLLPENPKVVDVGCGVGRDVKYLLDKGIETFGVDISREMLNKAKEVCPTGQFLLMDMNSLAFLKENFDGVWACASAFHIPKRLIGNVLQEFNRILNKGGLIFLSVQESEVEQFHEPEGRYFAFYQREDFRGLLKEHGFEVVHFEARSAKKTTFSKPMTVTWTNFWARKS